MPRRPLSRRWNPEINTKIKNYLKITSAKSRRSRLAIPDGQTMPGVASITIGGAKKMDAAILFFDLENFTNIAAGITMEDTLELLNYVIPSVMHIVRNWGGFFEKNTGDGVMAILGTETRDLNVIAQDAIECAMAIRYVMENNVQPALVAAGLPHINFRIGIDMGKVFIGRIGVHSHNFLSAVGTFANLASKIQKHARSNGICIGENIAVALHPHLYQFCEKGDHPEWNWQRTETGAPYDFYHFNHDWPDPDVWQKRGFFLQPRG